MIYDTVIGLEVHIQMNTESKAFCADGNTFGAEPNTHVSAISLAHPGTLPVANRRHVLHAVKLGLALGCTINKTHFFDRKHYFYPDLPKGYQITQDNQPVCIGGSLTIQSGGEAKKIRIHHIHMEEDAGKTVHDSHDQLSLLDLNRAGTPLLELVTEPDLSSGEEVFSFIAELQKLLRFVDVSDADMEKGSMRCDCNVSVKPKGSTVLGERCEIKNLNSKRFARDAVFSEAQRQIDLLEKGQKFSKQTLHYDPVTQQTSVLREKEGIADYRYFPDPDLPPIILSDEEINKVKKELPELPWHIKARLIKQHSFSEDYAEQLAQSPAIYSFFEKMSAAQDPRSCANLMINQILPSLEGRDLNEEHFKLSSDQCTAYLELINSGQVNASIAHQQLWPALLSRPHEKPETIADSLGLLINKDEGQLTDIISEILEANPQQVAQFRKGKKALIGFFIGAAMRKSGGSLDANSLKVKLLEHLNNSKE